MGGKGDHNEEKRAQVNEIGQSEENRAHVNEI